jgi:hypothetical protein
MTRAERAALKALGQVCAERDEAREQRDRARALACRFEEELALIRRSLSKAHRV